MAKIGERDYPADVEPEEARQYIEILVNDFGGKAGSEEAFAQAIGHSSTNSGSYLRKRGDLRKYGLLKPRSIEATELGYEAANPRDEGHERKLLFQMLQNIALLSDIYTSLNGSKPDEFWRVLTEITDANPKEAQDAEEKIENLYNKLVDYKPGKEEKPETTSQSEEGSPTQSEGKEFAPTPQSAETQPRKTGIFVKVGSDEIKMENITDSNLDLAKQFLESKKGSGTSSVQMRFQ